MHCPRCGAALHFRKPASVSRSWALLIAAVILYVPANTLPMMKTSSLFGSQSDTILSGVVYFWTSGSWYLALIIFFASIMVPMLKMIALALAARAARALVSPGGVRRPLVDARHLRGGGDRGAGAAQGARDHPAGRRRGRFRRRGGADDVLGDGVRPAADLGSDGGLGVGCIGKIRSVFYEIQGEGTK